MIRLLLVGIWICILTLGGVYAAVTLGNQPPEPADAAAKPATELVSGETLSLPIVTDGAVTGYFLARVSVTVDRDKAKANHVPMTTYVTDELFTLLVGNKMIDIPNVGKFDVAALRTKIKDGINARTGDALITDVMVEQLDFLSKDDLNSGETGKPSSSFKIIEGEKPADARPMETSH
ncbi:MAG TPA: hypothetical protein VK181_19130 [Rhizobium sp.]|nr:hypothetical protein [Rhizobium sp.]